MQLYGVELMINRLSLQLFVRQLLPDSIGHVVQTLLPVPPSSIVWHSCEYQLHAFCESVQFANYAAQFGWG